MSETGKRLEKLGIELPVRDRKGRFNIRGRICCSKRMRNYYSWSVKRYIGKFG